MRNITIGWRVYFCVALALLVIPIPWILAWITAALFHELCHYLCISLLGIRVINIKITVHGAVMETATMDSWQELLCAMAGPAGGLLLLLFSRWFPRLVICGFVQSLFNFLPLYPMDGGRILKCLIELLIPAKYAHKVLQYVQGLTAVVLSTVIVFVSFRYRLGFLPIVFVAAVWYKLANIKFACKHRTKRVQ